MRLAACLFVAVCLTSASAQTSAPSASEARAIAAFRQAEGNPLLLRSLLVRMPKGADLHMHLSGAVYAETFLNDARTDLMCVNAATGSLVSNVGTTRSIPPQPVCPQGTVRATDAFSDQHLYDGLVDAFSMRSFVPSSGISGHDQFFATFDRFDPTHTAGARHGGEWLDEVASRAAAQNEQYLEIMHTPDLGRAIELSGALHWPTAPATEGTYHQNTTGTTDKELTASRKALLESPGFKSALEADRAEFAKVLEGRQQIEQCGRPGAAAGCSVEIRFLFQVLRANSPAVVFAQTLLAFELAQSEFDHKSTHGDPMVLGVNFVQPEDSRMAMAEYTRQMRMIGFLHGLYPAVRISLHAGELAEGLVEPVGLRFHIRQAIELGHAERIGHGVDVMSEDYAAGLMKELATRHVMVEINLTSNDVILNVEGREHPLPLYQTAHVPVALSTDDEGVSRIDLTHEYVRAALEFHLNYVDLKRMVRTSLEHSFLPGQSLWREPDTFTRVVSACSSQPASRDRPGEACAAFLQSSARATQQWELERRFSAFETSLPATGK